MFIAILNAIFSIANVVLVMWLVLDRFTGNNEVGELKEELAKAKHWRREYEKLLHEVEQLPMINPAQPHPLRQRIRWALEEYP